MVMLRNTTFVPHSEFDKSRFGIRASRGPTALPLGQTLALWQAASYACSFILTLRRPRNAVVSNGEASHFETRPSGAAQHEEQGLGVRHAPERQKKGEGAWQHPRHVSPSERQTARVVCRYR